MRVFGVEGIFYRIYRAFHILFYDIDHRSYVNGHVAGYKKAIENHDKGIWCRFVRLR